MAIDMAIDNIVAHVLETTRACTSPPQLAREVYIRERTIFLKRVALITLATFAAILVIVLAHQRVKVDRIAVLEGKIPAITLGR